jgi:hypothetical protein
LFTARWHTSRVLDPDSFTAEWVETLEAYFPVGNPPNTGAVWAAAAHYKGYLDTASYGCLPPGVWDCKTLGRVVHSNLARVDDAHRRPPRIARKFPDTNWSQVWRNIHSKVLPQHVRDRWYEVVHDLVVTRALLHARKVDQSVTSPDCPDCGVRDDLEHRLTECDDADAVWGWLQQRLSVLLGVYVEPKAMMRPDFKAPDKVLQAAAVWLTGQTVAYLARGGRVIAERYRARLKEERKLVLSQPDRWPDELLAALRMFLNYV